MSRAVIRAIDADCAVRNWDNSLEHAFPEEVESWTRIRDRHLKRLRKALTQITREEFLRGRWCGTPMHERIAQWDCMIERANEA